MASARERRAALMGRPPEPLPQGTPMAARLVDNDSTPTEEPPMIIKFESVLLHKALSRLDAGKGQHSHTTQAFSTKDGVTIELDTASGLVRIAKGTATAHVPREGVERFGQTLEEAAIHAAALKEIDIARRKANAEAEAEAAASAATPA